MPNYVKTDTYYSSATPPGHSAISIIRMSGPLCLKALCKITKKARKKIIPRNAILTKLYSNNGHVIDMAVVTYYPAPFSYTGKDVVEISCHGSPVIVESVSLSLLKLGLRLSTPGEFTRDAFLNGKLDLVQAESVARLIQSKSQRAAEMNSRILQGDLTKKLFKIKECLVDALSMVEFELDISEEDRFRRGIKKHSLAKLKIAKEYCGSLITSYNEGRMYNKGLRIAILGRPNVGKSTLFNAIIERDRAITSKEPGTTRDTIDVSFSIGGIPVTLVDTAGIRESTDEIEKTGVERTMSEIKRCDLIVVLSEADTESELQDSFSKVPTIKAINKIDLLEKTKLSKLESTPNGQLFISALKKTGIEKLKDEIYKKINFSEKNTADVFLTTQRQFNSLLECGENIDRAINLLARGSMVFDIVSVDIKSAVASLDILLGKTTADDILNNIFKNFCVGK